MDLPESNHKERLPYEHYLKLYSQLEPSEVLSRTGVLYKDDGFTLRFVGVDYTIKFPSGEVVGELKPNEQILLLRYLISGRKEPADGEFLAYKDMPWGDVYQRNFQGRCIIRLARSFGYNPKKYEEGMEKLGALRLKKGDSCFEIEFLPGLSVRFIMWYGDDEFPPSAQILFSSNFPAAFTAEDMAVVGDILLDRLKKTVNSL